jgi:hypothetical protein
MGSVISTDVPEDLKEQIEAERGEDESRSATVRRVVRRGLDDDTIGIPYMLILFSSFLMGAAVTPTMEPAYLLILGVLLLAGGVLASRWGR